MDKSDIKVLSIKSKMFARFTKTWTEYGFEIAVIVAIAFLGICSIYHYFKNDKGTWNNFIDVSDPPKTTSHRARRTPPKESKGEVECKRVLEKLFGKPFPKERPDFLHNPVTGGGNNLEIDCFNRELRLGVEYQGSQHYEYTPFFHKSKEAFHNQKYRDEMKRVKCRENRIILIEVPYTVNIPDIEGYLVKELNKNGFRVTK
jgi:hypothetical protein